jgi:hypothetical protein
MTQSTHARAPSEQRLFTPIFASCRPFSTTHGSDVDQPSPLHDVGFSFHDHESVLRDHNAYGMLDREDLAAR